MKYLHVMNYANYVISLNFIRFVEDNFPTEEHTFLFWGEYNSKYENIGTKCEVIHTNISRDAEKLFSQAHTILLHGLVLYTKQCIMCLLKPWIMKKIVWIAWGGDLYGYKKAKSFSGIIKNATKVLFIKRLRGFVSIFDPDADFFRKNYVSRARIAKTGYPGGFYMESYKKTYQYISTEEKYRNGETINIAVGHQADPILNHIRVLKQLLAYKEENIQIYIPLSYGDMHNAENVEKFARENFGDKATVIKEIMPVNEYDQLLSKMDIAIFDTDRQIALGNINKYIHMKKKLYLSAGKVMHQYYSGKGVVVHDCEDIGKVSFSDFVQDFEPDAGVTYIKKRLDREAKINEWTQVFSLLG